ncbi:arginine--tRNA ligase [Paenibacillus sp. GCM10012306]|uniref:arginine--tRNA ligase n=1 Tax=Paenibacillus sp. GCM10012306 TaxID=3317342 RepID=UPI003617EF70
MLSQHIRDSLEQSVREVCLTLGVPYTGGPIPIEQPASLEHGDYASSIALQLAKTLRKAPMIIAGLIKDTFEQQGACSGLIREVAVAAPGFVNLYIHWPTWAQHSFVLPELSNEKIVVEHTSINPNKAAHIGHLRNSCIGDTLVRVLRRTGKQVEVHNYVDDLGNQLADTVVGLQNIPLEGEYVRFGDYCWDIYSQINKAYALEPGMVEKRSETLHALEEGRGNTAWLGNLVAERIVREHVEEMKGFGIDYDLLVWESSIVREGFWAAAFDRLSQTSAFVQETEGKLAGCWVLKQGTGETAEEGTENGEYHQDKVLVRSNGILTYTAKDIAYHLWKFGLLDKDFAYSEFAAGLWTTGLTGQSMPYGQADAVINVIDHRQEYPQLMVKQALQVLGYPEQAEKLYHVSYGVVSLSPASAAELGIDISDGKNSYAMSGRQGIGVKVANLISLMEETIEESRSDKSGLSSRIIAHAAIRYYLLRFNLGTEIVFDFRQATEISGNTGVYLMYTFARAGSVLGKAEAAGITVNAAAPFPSTPEAAELALLRHLSAWTDTLHEAAQELAPNLICTYAHTLATLFNNFYSQCPILKGEEDSIRFRVWLTGKFQATLGDALNVLGLPAPNRM